MQRLAIGAVAIALAITYVTGIRITTEPGGSYLQGDARSYFAYLPSLVVDRDLDLRNQFGVLQPEGESEYPFGPTVDGRRAHNPFPIAPAILWLPGYVAGLALDAAAGRARDPHFGYGAGAVLGTAVWSILLAGLGAELTRRTLAAIVDAHAALAATIMAWLGTPALYYTAISPLYSHAPAWASVSLMIWAAWNAWTRATPRWWAISGLAAGWMVAVRLQDLPLLAVPAALLALAVAGRRTTAATAAAWSAAVAAGYFVQAATWYSFDGTLIPFNQDPLTPPTLANLAGVLFSTGYRGWISWTPIVLPGLAGLAVLARGAGRPVRWLSIAAIAGVAGMILLDVMHPFGAGASYGGRRYVSLTPFIALGLAAVLARSPSRRVAWLVLAALTAWNLWILFAYEMLIIRHGVYPTLAQAVRYGVGLGPP